MTDHTTNSISKTMPYSGDKNDASNKTVGYESETARTQTYEEEVRIADKTVGYESEETELIDKTIAHGLAVGDVIELNDKEYEITDIICAENQTGEAIIYKIKNSQAKPFALKLYYQFTNPKDEPNPEALRRIKAINDPDILKLYDFGTGTSKYQNKFCYEISEFAEGSNLLSVPEIRKKYTIEFLKLNVIQEIFKGIRTLHNNKIYHCDLKPENILYLDKEQTDLIIGDYGSAKTFEETSEKRLTHTSTTKGTNFYLAPEQPRGIVSEKNDYYSFGMILLHLVYPELVNRNSLHKIIERQFAKKPIIDFDPEYGEMNDLIAGLTLHDIGSRWGENEVKGWLNSEEIEVKYKSEAEVAAQPIKLGKATIRTTEELIDYIENNIDWHLDLIEDKEGYGLLLRWVSDIQDLGRKKIFDKMVRNYQQDGEGFLKQSVLRYFTPERPIQIDMKTYDFWTEEKIDELTERFISHLDDIWKITPLEKIKFYIFQLEFTLRQIEAVTQGQQKVLVQSIIEKISSALSISPRLDFDDYVCNFYDGLNDSKLISLFYAFDAKRVFKDLENKEYNTVEDIGLFFARNKNLYGNKYLKLEKEVFFKSNNYSNYVNLSYDEFLYSIFNKNIKSQIQISDVLFDLKKSPKDIQIKYKFGKSLTDFFSKMSVNNTLAQLGKEESIVIPRGGIPFSKKIYNKFIKEIETKHNIKQESIGQNSRNSVRSDFSEHTRGFVKSGFKKCFLFTIGAVSFLLPVLMLILLLMAFGSKDNNVIQNILLHITPFNINFSSLELLADNFAYGINFLIFISFIPAATFYFGRYAEEKSDLVDIKGSALIWLLAIFLIIGPVVTFVIVIAGSIILFIPVHIISLFAVWTADDGMETVLVGIVAIFYFMPGMILLIVTIVEFFAKFNEEKFYLKSISIALSTIFFIATLAFFINLSASSAGNSGLEQNPAQKVRTNKRQNYATINVTAANVRSGPSTKYSIISVVKKGEQFEIISNDKGWYVIKIRGKEGYIWDRLVQEVKRSR